MKPLLGMGDSVMYGVRAGVVAGQEFLALLAARAGCAMINQGVPGNTSSDMVRRLPAALATMPGCAIIMAGENDPGGGVSAPQTLANLRQLRDGFLAVGSAVVFLAPWLQRTGAYIDAIPPYVAAASVAAQERGLPYFDIYNLCWQKWITLSSADFSALYVDNGHPSPAGHAVIAATVQLPVW